MSRSTANAENIALNLEYAAKALAEAQDYLNTAVSLADHEEEGYGSVFANLRGAVANTYASVAFELSEWRSTHRARERRDSHDLAELRRKLSGI